MGRNGFFAVDSSYVRQTPRSSWYGDECTQYLFRNELAPFAPCSVPIPGPCCFYFSFVYML